MRQSDTRLLAHAAVTAGTLFFSLHAAATENAALLEQFDIKAQSLSTALREYAQATGEQVVFFSDVGKKRDSAPVKGQYTREQALQKILENTGLNYQRLNSKTIAIGTAPQRTSEVSYSSAALKTIRLAQLDAQQATAPPSSSAASEAGAPEQGPEGTRALEEVIVTGTAVQERTRFDSSVAISTFSADEIAQQAPASSADLISAVPGFWVESTAGTTQGNVFARGIIQDGGYRYVTLMEDGIPVYPVSELSFYNPDQFVRVDETIDHVEALRGGTAPIFNTGAIGGTVNFVTKSPRDNADGLAKLTISDYGLYRADVSWRAPLSDDWGMAIGGYYRKSDGIRDPGYDADKGGQLRFKIARRFENGNLEFFAKYINDHSLFAVPIPLQGNPSDPHAINGQDAGTYSLHSADLNRAPLPVSAAEVGLRGSKLEDGIHPDLFTGGVKLSWEFNDVVSLSDVLRYTDGSVRFDGIFPGDPPSTGTAFAAARGVAPVYTVLATGAAYAPTQFVQNHGHWVVNKDYQALQNDLRVNFKLDRNNLAIGAYIADYSMKDRWSLGNLLLMTVSDQPKRLALPGVTDPNGYTQYSFFNLSTDDDATAYALYVSDEWQVVDKLRLDFGVRYDQQSIDARISNATSVNLDGNLATTYDNGTSVAGPLVTRDVPDYDNTGYSVGFNFDMTDTQALFGHYTKSAKLPHFDDVRGAIGSNVRLDKSQLRKDEVTNIEFGYKVATPLIGMFATLFQTEFDNIPFQDILANGQTIVRRAGTRTRGIELEGVLQPVDPLEIRFSITQQDPKYTSFAGSVLDNTGNVIRRIPKSMIRLTPTYKFLDDRARAYFTFTRAGKRFANDENTIELPAYNKFDAGVIFDVNDAWTVQVTADNLTDEVGLTEGNPRTDVGAGGIGAVYMARPLFGRSWQASATVRF